MKNPETKIEDYFKEQVKQRGGFTRKYRSPGLRGVPDRIMFWKGVAFVEIKTGTGALSLLQQIEFKKMQGQQVPVFVLKSKVDVDNFLRLWEPRRPNDEGKLVP